MLFTGTVDEESFFKNERTSGIKQWRDALQSLFSISRLLLCIFSERTTLNGPDRLSHALLMMMAMIRPAPPQSVFKQRAPLCFRHSSWFATWKYETYSTEILPFNFSRGPNQWRRPSFTTPSRGIAQQESWVVFPLEQNWKAYLFSDKPPGQWL